MVWEPIALHTSPGIAERRGPLAFLTRGGIGIDFGRGSVAVTDEQAAAIFDAYHATSELERETTAARWGN